MDISPGDFELIQQLQQLESQYLSALASGVEACNTFARHLDALLAHVRGIADLRREPCALKDALARVYQPLTMITQAFKEIDNRQIITIQRQTAAIEEAFKSNGFRRRRKRSTRSRKSKVGKSGKVRQSGKKSKRGRKSPVGNPKRRPHLDVNGPTSVSGNLSPSNESGKKSRTVTAPPTDSMKFGACRDFFLSHLGNPYPTTVQKHQILKQSSSDFTLRSLNLWFVNIRRRSKWMDIFKKHAGSKRDTMQDLVARVEAQVAGRPAPNPLPSGAAPPGCKVDEAIVEEVMSMRAVVDMVSREVYGEGWDQILQIKPWTDEEVRAHEERKKAQRREARANKLDGEKRKQERETRKEERKRDREERKRIEQSAVQGIHAARELHEKLLAMNKRKRGDNDDGSQESPERRKDQEGEGGNETRIRVPKVDENGKPLSKKERKALKKALLAGKANPLKRKSPEFSEDNNYPGVSGETSAFPDGLSPSKRRRRDAAIFEGFPGTGENTDGTGMADLSQLFSIDWASPATSVGQLPPSENSPTPVPAPAQASEFGEFVPSSESQDAPMPCVSAGPGASVEIGGEQPRRYSQQLAEYALQSGMFGGDNFELFTEDTFPGMSVDLNQEPNMTPFLHTNVPNHRPSPSMNPTQVRAEPRTPIPNLATPEEPQAYSNFPHPHHPYHPPPSPYSSTSTITPTGDGDSDMSWLNAALAQLPSEHDAQHHQFNAPGSQGGFNTGYAGNQGAYGQPVYTVPAESRAPVSHQRTSMGYVTPQPLPSQPHHDMPPQHTRTPSIPPAQPRRSFPHPPSHSPAPNFPHPQPHQSQPQPQSRRPGGLWQIPYSQPAQPQPQPQPQQYHHPPTPSFPAPSPSPSRSFPAPVHQNYNSSHNQRDAYIHHPGSASPQEYHHNPVFPQPQPQRQYAPAPSPGPAPAPVPDAASILKQHELEFARAQEELRNRFKREQDEQLERFLRAQEDLKKQLLPEGNRS
ncbi:unnamed protein product [Rhizoctonia solani]|uniref:Homeobox domain-containing protein n=1 Tax=Rhizoctonia solani TaxID=456999 RepID=A0A8H3AZ26_9AGAM|nr:unnamed protein product [Rhizoctonia solani]